MTDFDYEQSVFWSEHANLRPYNHPIVETFSNQRVSFVRGLLEEKTVSSALDVGCGDGFGIYYMQDLVSAIWGCDISVRMLQENPVSRNCLCQANAYILPYADRSFDLVYCWELLHHISEPTQVIAEMTRVSRKYVLAFEPNCLNPIMALFGMFVPWERGLLRFTPWYLRRLMKEAGLLRVKSLTVGSFAPNRIPWWLFRILKRLPYRWPLFGISNLVLSEVT